MQAFLISTAVVALAEIGDKTQLLAFVLAARFRNLLAGKGAMRNRLTGAVLIGAALALSLARR